MDWEKYDFWKKYRQELIKELNNQPCIEKTAESIVSLAKEIGIKPTARYFQVDPNTVRYYIKKTTN